MGGTIEVVHPGRDGRIRALDLSFSAAGSEAFQSVFLHHWQWTNRYDIYDIMTLGYR